VATASGFLRQEYGQRILAADGKGIPVYLEAGQNIKDLTIRMTATSVVSGHLMDDAGNPAIGAPVQLLQVSFGPSGKTVRAVVATTADDRGVYRIFSLAPGSYMLVAGNPPGPQRPSIAPAAGGGSGLIPPPSSVSRSGWSYALSYYPTSPDINGATLFEVQPGGEFRADMTLNRQGRFTVSGRIIDGRTGRPPAAPSILLAYRALSGVGGSFSARPMYDRATGSFEIEDVTPGPWFIQASVQDPTANLSSLTPFRVTSANVDGLVVTMTPGITIEGRIATEVGMKPVDLQPGSRVQLRQSTNGKPDSSVFAGGPPAQLVAPDGSFRFENVRYGEYIVGLLPSSTSYYVKGIQLGKEDVLNNPFIINGPIADPLKITLRTGGGRISGGVIDSKSVPVPGIQTVLIPEPDLRNRLDLFRTAITDHKGKFALEGIPPGDYKIFSWEALEPAAYYDPDVLMKYEDQGRAVHVDETSSITADIKLISKAGR